MKALVRASLVLLLLAGLARLAGAQELSLVCLGGEKLSEGDLSRGTTIVVVWASWSPRSRDVVQRINPLVTRWKGSARVMAVNFEEERHAVEVFLAGKGLAAPVCLDSEGLFSRKYNVATLPGLLVVKDGQVAYRGKLPDDPDRVIADLLK
ncbi:MAG TPA: TlpA disulfide reductase family protein [Thermoanaerobaculia bacterium]|nr:TlpA disulfide reductase family protein [Thermoanaerobaculia bacterium]